MQLLKKFKILIIINFLFFLTIANAKNYNINLLLDKQSNKYLESIKIEVESLISKNDKIDFKINKCLSNCEEMISNNNLVLIRNSKKIKEHKNSYIITYNSLYNKYDENKIIRAAALGIHEYLKENKKNKSIHINNKKSELFQIDEEVKNNQNKRKLKIEEIFQLVSKNNFQIQQNKNSLKIDKLNVKEAISDYKPKIDFYSNLIQVDKDRAKYSNGLQSERELEAGLRLKQMIYSDKILKNISIKELLELSNKNSIKSQNDEIVYKSLVSYLNLIKASKYKHIIKIKQIFIKENLELSKQRVEVGVQDKRDRYRWENELANVNIDLINSQKQINTLKTKLANLLQIDSNYSFVEYGMDSKIFKLLNNDAINYISNEKVQELFLNNIIYKHPSLKQINELINAKNEQRKMNKSSRYLPTIAFEGSINRTINRYAEGADAKRYTDDNEYQGLINLSLPLYEGGSKSINIEKNEIELINLKLEYNRVKSIIEKNLNQNYDSLQKAYEKISYSKLSLKFSKKNYGLVQNRYINGKENIISLLDAQNSFIISKLNETISSIDYLQDLISIYYFSGKIDILSDEKKKNQMEEKILKVIKD